MSNYIKVGDRIKGYGADCPRSTLGVPFGTVREVGVSNVVVAWDNGTITVACRDGIKVV